MTTHIKKTGSFALVHFTVAFGVSWALTGDWRIASALALIEPLVNTFAFFLHELAWGRRRPSIDLGTRAAEPRRPGASRAPLGARTSASSGGPRLSPG